MTVSTNSTEKTVNTTGVGGARPLTALAMTAGLALAAGFATAYGLPLLAPPGERLIGWPP